MAQIQQQQLLHRGQVKFYNRVKRYGFIRDTVTGDEYFVHGSAIYDDPTIPKFRRCLNDGEYVDFALETDSTKNNSNLTNKNPSKGPMVSYVIGRDNGLLMYQTLYKKQETRKQRRPIQQQQIPH